MLSLLDKGLAIFRRDLLTAMRYRTGFLLSGAGAIAELAAFYYLSRAIGPGFRPEGIDYFPFVMIGTGFYTFMVMGISSFLNIVQEAQQTGTLEILMTTATPPAVLVTLSAVSAFAANSVQLMLFVGGGIFLSKPMPLHPNLAGCLMVLLFSLLIALAIGLFAAAVQVATQKGSAVVWMLGSGLWFLTGALFPVSSLPKPLQIISTLLPITHVLSGLRLAILERPTLTELMPEIRILGIFAGVLLPASLLAFTATVRKARLEGTLSFY